MSAGVPRRRPQQRCTRRYWQKESSRCGSRLGRIWRREALVRTGCELLFAATPRLVHLPAMHCREYAISHVQQHVGTAHFLADNLNRSNRGAADRAGYDVKLLDAAANPGGLSAGWRTKEGKAVEAGMKGFWYEVCPLLTPLKSWASMIAVHPKQTCSSGHQPLTPAAGARRHGSLLSVHVPVQYPNIFGLVKELNIPNPFTPFSTSGFWTRDGLSVSAPVFSEQQQFPALIGQFIHTSPLFTCALTAVIPCWSTKLALTRRQLTCLHVAASRHVRCLCGMSTTESAIPVGIRRSLCM